MSFFGFEANTDALQKEKERFLQHGLEEEKLAVFNWGESDYDGLGEVLQEGGDELNDETFGDSGPVGKDFDFTKTELTNFEKERFISQYQPETVGSLLPGKKSQSGISQLKSTPSGASWHDSSSHAPPNTRRGNIEYQSTAPGKIIAPSAAHHTVPPTAVLPNHVRTLEEIESELLKQRPPQPAYQVSVIPSATSPDAINNMSLMSLIPQSQSQDYTGYDSQRSTSAEIEHQLRMMHLNQLQHLQANRQDQLLLQQQQLQVELLERQQHQQQQLQEQLRQEQLRRIQLRQLEELEQQEQMREMQQMQQEQKERLIRQVLQHQQQQQPLYQTHPHPRQVRTPDQFGGQNQFQRSFPNTPEPHLPPQQNFLTPEQRNQLQMQRQVLLQLSQAGVSPDQIHLLDGVQREAIMNEARRKIQAAEQLDQRNRRRLAKMERMARYNDLMTQSDKDFITRIQVSQLVTSDPYTEDFYAQVLGSLRRGNVKWFGNSNVGQRLNSRREHAMHRMAEQVYRIVENAKAREKEKGQNGVNPLQGVLGKTSGRSYKAAPRQLLQVESVTSPSPNSSPRLRDQHLHHLGPEDGKHALPDKNVYENIEVKEPLTYRQALAIIENLFDYTIEWETNRRFIPEENTEDYENWLTTQKAIEAKMWEASQINAPLDGRYPHPLVSVLTPLKGKKVLKRIIRVMDARQLRITLTLVTRLFRDFDIIQDYHVTESLIDTKEKQETERHVHAFEEYVLDPLLSALAVAPLSFVSGQLHLLTDPVTIARTRPGIILLTHIFTRAAVIKDRTLTFQAGGVTDGMIGEDIATAEEFQQWQTCFDNLFQLFAPHFLSFFPSIRIIASLPYGAETQLQNSLALDAADQPVWGFFAAMAVPATLEQQGLIVTQLREKVLEIVLRIQQGWIVDENERDLKLRNINSFLHAIGLDSSQINL
ncbi:hypothetical protein Clacol_005595 [Clathrus columnatus]|uniref:mRNA decay factor PAT1 domain-containing protein n=1 Tax=Clathrus columnatus TaxID=1419009 RepID=A0AAV5AE19_9AGAM|nr:hypothetical protein Clacol_005595 [Clathrus columnatus]